MKHLAILNQPFLDMILGGEKTIESRWSKNKIPPFEKVAEGDEILLKESGKTVVAKAKVRRVKYFHLTPIIAEEIREKYGKEIGIDRMTNWSEVKNKRYCTLIWLGNIEKVEKITAPKSHGSGWLILD